MLRPDHAFAEQVVFRPSLHRFLGVLALTLGAGAARLLQALSAGANWGWILTLGSLLTSVALAARFTGHAVILCGDELIVRTGTLWMREVCLPLVQVQFEVRRSVLGVWGDYGTLLLHAGDQVIAVPHIAQLRALRRLVMTRRLFVLQLHRSVLLPSVWAPEPADARSLIER